MLNKFFFSKLDMKSHPPQCSHKANNNSNNNNSDNNNDNSFYDDGIIS